MKIQSFRNFSYWTSFLNKNNNQTISLQTLPQRILMLAIYIFEGLAFCYIFYQLNKKYKIFSFLINIKKDYFSFFEKKYDDKKRKQDQSSIPKTDPMDLLIQNFFLDVPQNDEQLKQSLIKCEEDSKNNPNDINILRHYGETLYHLKRYDEARKKFKVVLEKKENDVYSLCGIAYCYQRSNNLTKAEKYFKSAVYHAKDSVTILNSYANFLCKVNDDDALKHFERVLEISPKDYFALCQSAKILIKKRQFNFAKERYEKAIAINNKDFSSLREYAMVLFIMKDFKNAEKNFILALKYGKDDFSTKKGYADTLKSLEKYEEALSQYKDLLKIVSDTFNTSHFIPEINNSISEIEEKISKKP